MRSTCIFCGTEYQANLESCTSCGMASTAPDRTLAMGTELHAGKFTVGRVLGEGGFGITYKGAHRSLRRTVAIKELFPEGAVRLGANVSVPKGRQADFRHEMDSILQEARLIASLRSPTIVDVHDMFQENGTAYIVMEYLEGQTLQEEIDRRGQLPSERVQEIALETCEALAEVHSNNLLHRDVKPANIILTRDYRTVLIDFGSAREFKVSHTARHTRILTEEYAAPEQYSARARFGPYTDVFCLGATLFHALTGAPPPRALDRLQDIASPLTFPGGVGKAMRSAIRQALNLKVQERPQTIEDFKELLLERGSSPHGTVPVIASFSATPASTRDSNSSSSDNNHPYVFKSKPFHSPPELAVALSQDWDAAISDWKRGYIRAWMTREATAIDFERGIDSMLEDPLFCDPSPNSLTTAAYTRGDSQEIAVLERQLLRVISLMDPAWPPSYRGMPLQDKFALREWLVKTPNNKLVDRCIRHQVLLAHPKKFGRQLHEDLQQQVRTCHHHLAKRGFLALKLLPGGSDDFMHWWHSELSRTYKLQIFSFLVGAEASGPLRARMKQDLVAMRIKWFRESVDAAANSHGCAAALESLQLMAQREDRKDTRTGCIAIAVIALIVFFAQRLAS